jgi:hypothetical protein
VFRVCFESNHSLLVVVDQSNWLIDAARLPTATDDLEPRTAIVHRFLECCFAISKESPYWRRKLCQGPMK